MSELIPGISEDSISLVLSILKAHKAVKEAILFGSRAKGTYKPGSDIDIAIKGENIDKDVLSSLNAAFEESPLIYFVDVISYSHITNLDLKNHIDRVGKVFFKRP